MTRRLGINAASIVVLAIVAAAVVTLIIQRLNPEGLGDWLRTLSATAMSALFAVAIGIWLFNRQTEITDERRRRQLVEVLKAEISNIKDEVVTDDPAPRTTVMTESGEFTDVLLPEGLELITIDEAVRSGLLPTDVTVQLVHLAGWIRSYDARVRRAQSILQAETIDKMELMERGAGYFLDSTVVYLEAGRKKVKEECERMLDRLEQLTR